MMKVAFVGTHGQGKTALVYDQAARFKRNGINVEIVKEVARSCPLPINQNTSYEAQVWILMTQIAKEIKAANTAQLVICDRAVLDNFAYLLKACPQKITRELTAWIRQWLRSYDLLIKVPLVSRPQEDGIRSTDAQFAAEIDCRVDALGRQFVELSQWRQLSANRENWSNESYQFIKERL